VALDPPERRAFLAEVARPRLNALVQLLADHAARTGRAAVPSDSTP
jgi:hypothetical protein